jgi:hypothetical protein
MTLPPIAGPHASVMIPDYVATPAVRAWVSAYEEWWASISRGNEARAQLLCNQARNAWLDLDEPERAGAWAWYVACRGDADQYPCSL